MNYADAIAFWFGRINYEVRSAAATDLKLERMRALLRLLGDPQDRLRIVHVTGTKGKGSVSAMLDAMLRAAGYRVGLFTSPHLERVEERFQVNRASISEPEFCTLMEEVAEAVQVLDKSAEWPAPTFFEISTAVGFLHFVRRRVDVAIVEVGLGGRFDSTNVCRPLLTILTSVGFDHMAQLGKTLAAIAYQKAGILKRNVPCISGVSAPEARDVVRAVAADLNVPLIERGSEQLSHRRLGKELWVFGPSLSRIGLHLNLLGAHQDANAALAVAAVDALNAAGLTIPERAVHHGLRTVVWPARIECVQREPFAVVVDSAHNVPSAEALVTTLREAFPTASPRIAVFAVSNDKQYREMLAILGAYFTHLELTIYTYNARSVPAQALAETLDEVVPGRSCTMHAQPIAAWQAARVRAAGGGLVVICGSVFLAGELRGRILTDLGEAP